MTKHVNVYPVIHHLDWATTYTEAGLAYKTGADGVFLISHHNNDIILLELANTIKEAHGKFVGINLLSYPALRSFHLAAGLGIDAMWADAVGVTSSMTKDDALKLAGLAKVAPSVKVFASVAFKYQPVDNDPAGAATKAWALGFLPTTSGSGTGSAPDVAKIKSMSEVVGGKLAIASGMTPENVSQFVPYVSDILVSTGVSKDGYHFDPIRLKQLIDICHDNDDTSV